MQLALAKKSAVSSKIVIRKDNIMRKIKKVSDYQKEYDTMVKIAKSSLENGVDLTPQFERELLALTKLVKSFGGRV